MIIAPVRQMLIRIGFTLLDEEYRFSIIRMVPYPPSFKRMAASTMDPAIGASTWALGSQRCIVNMGSLTKNPLIRNSRNRLLNEGGIVMVRVFIFDEREWSVIRINIISIGSEANTV